MENDTARAMELAVKGGASGVLGMVFERQARERDWLDKTIMDDKDREIARLTQERNDAWEELFAMRSRIAWLMTGDLPEELR